MSKKVTRFFRKKYRGDTLSVAAPGVTHTSDATWHSLTVLYGYVGVCVTCVALHEYTALDSPIVRYRSR